MKFFVILAVVGITTAQLAHHHKFTDFFEVADQPQAPFAPPIPIRPEQNPWIWNGQLPVEKEPGTPRWGNNPRWGEQSPEQSPEIESEQPQRNGPRWNQSPQPEQEQHIPRLPPWAMPQPRPEQHIPRLPPWVMPQPESEPETRRWNDNPRWNQWQRPEPQPDQGPIMRPSPPEPELISPPVERPIRPNFPQQPPVAPRASWRNGQPDVRCPIPDNHQGIPFFINGNEQWSFFMCWGGIAWPFECPQNSVYRPQLNVCADPAWNPKQMIQMQPYQDEVVVEEEEEEKEEVEQAAPYEEE